MAGTDYNILVGSTLAFGTTSWAAKVTAVNLAGVEAVVHDVSHMGLTVPTHPILGNRVKIPGGLIDPGHLEVEFWANPGTPPHVGAAAETLTFTYPLATGDSTAAKFAGSAICKSFEGQASLEQPWKGKAVFEITGGLTFTPAT